MRMIALKIGSVVFLVFASAGQAQVDSMPPKGWTRMTPIYGFPGSGFNRLNLTNNTPDEIRKELLDTNISRLIARFNSLSDEDLATVQISQDNGKVEVYQIGNSDRAFKTMSEQLRIYSASRDEGHTRDFCMAALTNRTDLSSVTDPYLRALLKERPMLPADRLTNSASTAYTNKAGTIVSQSTSTTFVNGKMVTTNVTEKPKGDEVGQRVDYVLVDGEIAWVYFVQFKPDGTVDYVMESRRDAKEFDPKYSQTIKEVEDEVKKAGIHGRGSVHIFWSIVQKKLKNNGIDWHSPAELNPNTRFD
jgi:hypothetical protein